MVLMILVNIGQLTNNVVSKSIYISKVSPVMSSIFSNGDNTPSVRGQNSPLLVRIRLCGAWTNTCRSNGVFTVCYKHGKTLTNRPLRYLDRN